MGDEIWRPQKVREVIRVLSTSTEPVEVLTDAGRAYLKHPQNREGSHALACEWLGTRLAQRLGLRTFETTRIAYDGLAKIELSNGTAAPADCFITKYVDGYPWDGTAVHLKRLDYRDGLTTMVVLDSWLRNTDRQFVRGGQVHRNPSNVFFAATARPKWFSLIAMDFSQLLLPLWPRFDVKHAAQLALDQEVYGLFPEFIPLLRRTPLNDAIARIQEINSGELRALLEEIPDSWGADAESRKSTVEFLLARAEFLTETLVNRLESMATVLGREGNNRNEDAE